QREVERGAAAGVRRRPEAPAVRLDDAAADREAEPEPGLLGREEGVEDLLLHGGRDAVARVADRHLDRVGVGGDGRDQQAALAPARLRHGFERVQEEVQDHLLDLHAVHLDRWYLATELEPYRHALLAG